MTDEGLSHLSNLSSLKRLRMGNTKITDVGFQKLQTLPKLTNVHVGQSAVTEGAIEELKKRTDKLWVSR